MFATTGSAFIETGLQITPLGPVGKILHIPRWAKFALLKNAKRREMLRTGKLATMAKNAERGFEIGSVASPIAGALYAPIHVAVSPVVKKAGRVARELFGDISTTSNIAEGVSKNLLRKKFGRDVKRRYFKDIAGRYVLSAASEGNEEYKQFAASERFKSGGYNDAKIKSLGETVLDDFLAGIKGGGLILGMPFEGVMSESDRRALQEIKGGMIMGGLQTAIVNTASSISPYRKEQKATTAILNSVLLDKATKVDTFNKAKVYSEMAKSSSSYQSILDKFDTLQKMNQNVFDSTGEYGVAPEYIDQEIKSFRDVAKMSLDGYTIKQAQAQGIDIDSEEYNQFVAAKTLTQNELNEAAEVAKAATANRKDVETNIIDTINTERLKSIIG